MRHPGAIFRTFRMPFSTLGLSPSLCAPLARLGYTQPTPVQLKSIPIALSEAWEAGRVKKGDLVCLTAFGSGFTWGSALMRW